MAPVPVPVEAKSLSEVMALAENPPLKLEMNSTQEPHEKLVLYIARVPGSRGLSCTYLLQRYLIWCLPFNQMSFLHL